MPDVLEQLKALIASAESSAQSEAQEQRLQRMEDRLEQLLERSSGAAPLTPEQMLERLAADDDFMDKLGREVAAEADGAAPGGGGGDDDGGGNPSGSGGGSAGGSDDRGNDPPAGPRFRRVRLDIPRIWDGEDEPDELEYLDEDGQLQRRRGRKRGAPTEFDFHEVAPAAADPPPPGDDDAAGGGGDE